MYGNAKASAESAKKSSIDAQKSAMSAADKKPIIVYANFGNVATGNSNIKTNNNHQTQGKNNTNGGNKD